MELSFLLIQQIIKLFIMVLIGFVIVKNKLLKASDSKVISTLVLYIIAPCAILNSFQIAFTQDKLLGLGVSFLGAIVVHIIFIPLTNLLSKLFGFNSVEKASIIYSNAGNLIIPLVGAILGQEWVLYTSGYMVIQTILLWTHGKKTVCDDKTTDYKKIFMNINVMAIAIGIILFLFNIQLPLIIRESLTSIGSMIGTLSMLVIGMLIGNMDLSGIFIQKRAYLVCLFRLLIYPMIIILVFKLSGMTRLHPDATQILLITTLATCAPVAATITQFAQLYDRQPGYTSMINVISVIFCIITMPLMIMIYQII